MSAKIWLAARKPKACAKCKSRNWDTMVVVAEAATTISKIDTINHVIEYSVESAKLAHNPKTCRVYRCGMCAAIKGA